MRKHKYKAWDKKNKVWAFDWPFHIIGETTMFDLLNQYSIEAYNDLVIVEYTGLNDKNGKEIYEGDIVSICEMTSGGDGPIDKILQKFPVALVEWNKTMLAYVYSLPRKDRPPLSHQMLSLGGHIKIIGNMFENPELLNVK